MVSTPNPLAEAQRVKRTYYNEINLLKQKLRLENDPYKRSQYETGIKNYEKRIAEIQAQEKAGAITDADIIARAQKRVRTKRPSAPSGSLSAQPTSGGVRPSTLPGSVRDPQVEELLRRAQHEKATGDAQEGARLEAEASRILQRKSQRETILSESRAMDNTGQVRDIPYKTVQGKTQSVVSAESAEPFIGLSPKFAGKAATVKGVDVRTVPKSLKPSTDVLRAGEPSVKASINEKLLVSPHKSSAASDFLPTVEQPRAASVDLERAQLAASILFEEGRGFKSPFDTYSEYVKVDGILFKKVPEFAELMEAKGLSKQKLTPAEFEAKYRAEILKVRPNISKAKIQRALRFKEQQARNIKKIEARIEKLKESGPDSTDSKNQSYKAVDYGQSVAKKISEFSSAEVISRHQTGVKTSDYKKLSILKRIELGFQERINLPSERDSEKLAAPLIGGGLALGAVSIVAPVVGTVAGAGLGVFDVGTRGVAAYGEIKTGADPIQVIAGEGPKIAASATAAALGVAGIKESLPKVRTTKVKTASVARRTGTVAKRTGVNIKGATPIDIKQQSTIVAKTETVEKTFLRAEKKIGESAEVLKVTQTGRGFAGETAAVVVSEVKASKVKPDYSRVVPDDVMQASYPLEKVSKGVKVGKQAAKVQKVLDKKIAVSESVVRTPDYTQLFKDTKRKVSVPKQKQERFKSYGELEESFNEEGFKQTMAVKVVTKESESLVQPKRPIFTKKEAKQAFNIPEGEAVGMETSATVEVAAVSKLPAKEIIKARRIKTPDVKDALTGKPVIDQVVKVPTGKYEGGDFGAFVSKDISFTGKGELKPKSPIKPNNEGLGARARSKINDVKSMLRKIGRKKDKTVLQEKPKSFESGKVQVQELKTAQKTVSKGEVLKAVSVDEAVATKIAKRVLGRTTKISGKIKGRSIAALGVAKALSVTKARAVSVGKATVKPASGVKSKILGEVTQKKGLADRIKPKPLQGQAQTPSTDVTSKTKIKIPQITTPGGTTTRPPQDPRIETPPELLIPKFKREGQRPRKQVERFDPYKGTRTFKVKTAKQFFKQLFKGRR